MILRVCRGRPAWGLLMGPSQMPSPPSARHRRTVGKGTFKKRRRRGTASCAAKS
jgi:hypothetical protein